MQKMMSNMSDEDMQKWAGRAQKVASVAQKPMAAYKSVKDYASKLGYGGALAALVGMLAIMMVGHFSGSF